MTARLRQVLGRVRRSAWVLALAALTAGAMVAINEGAYDRSTTALARLDDREAALARIQAVWRAVIDAETGQRGHLLTGRPEYLPPYHRATAEVHASLDWLGARYREDAEAAPLLADMARSSDRKLSELATTLALYGTGASGGWRDLMLTDIGREQMEALRLSASRLLAIESQRVTDERRDVWSTLDHGRHGIAAITLLVLLGLGLFMRQTRAADRVQQAHARALRAERDRLAAEAARRTADLTDLARHLQTACEDERSRLARELHDELGALLTAAKLDAARLKRAIGEHAPQAQARLVDLNGSINRGIELKRRMIEDLWPSSLGNLGLVAALEILTRDQSARTGVPVRTDLHPVALTDSAQITVFRLVQEALDNSARHAAASAVNVALHVDHREGHAGVRVSVQDNGRGFDAGAQRGTTHGLMGLHYRIEAEGGEMQVDAQPGAGTRVAAWLPARPG